MQEEQFKKSCNSVPSSMTLTLQFGNTLWKFSHLCSSSLERLAMLLPLKEATFGRSILWHPKEWLRNPETIWFKIFHLPMWFCRSKSGGKESFVWLLAETIKTNLKMLFKFKRLLLLSLKLIWVFLFIFKIFESCCSNPTYTKKCND